MEKLNLEDLVIRPIIDWLDNKSIRHSVEVQGGKYIAELEFYTSHGGDQLFNVWFDFDSSNEDHEEAKISASLSFADGLEEIFWNFDIDEYVTDWLIVKREQPEACGLDARTLVKDGEEINGILEDLWLSADEIVKNYIPS